MIYAFIVAFVIYTAAKLVESYETRVYELNWFLRMVEAEEQCGDVSAGSHVLCECGHARTFHNVYGCMVISNDLTEKCDCEVFQSVWSIEGTEHMRGSGI